MTTIETNEGEAVGLTMREAIIDQVLPIVRTRPAAVVEEREPVGLGWLRDLPDFRDYTEEHESIRPQLETIGVAQPEQVSAPATIDLRAYCSPVENQGSLGSCERTPSSGSSSTSSAARTAGSSTRHGSSSTR